ncbi:MAG: DUF2083 domain-containing protein [Polyangiaceae bacterium]|nr:DUF2083 domain-containing protein [Polyangiaceae bacterium]
MTTARKAKNDAPELPRLGAKVRAVRRRGGLSQQQLAEKLGISASYLNLIENHRRPLPAPLLVKLAQLFEMDLGSFAVDDDSRLVSDLMEAFSDRMFEGLHLTQHEVRELLQSQPTIARAILTLYGAYAAARGSAEHLAWRVVDEGDEEGAPRGFQLPSEEVSDLIQRHLNHFPELEEAAEELWRRARFDREQLYGNLIGYLHKAHGVAVEVVPHGAEPGILRRFDARRGLLRLSELLPTRSRKFQVAHQLALLEHHEVIDGIVADPMLSTDEARALARAALANYFAAALLMPYGQFCSAAEEERYDIDVLGRRFRVGFEQACHRLTSLRRPGREGVPLHMIRIDVAGNISKRFSASGIRFARYSGACPRWNVFAAFMTPGMIRIQVSKMPDGEAYFCIARSIQKDAGGFHAQHPVQAIGLGCRVEHAKRLVYSDGVELEGHETAVNVGVTCRLCERTDCEQRAFPSVGHALRIEEDVRRLSVFTPVGR